MITLITPVIAILSIIALEFYALSQGINGVMLAGSIAVISGLGGYTVKSAKDKITKDKGG